MSARILVVDDVPANVKLLEARLSAEYFDVMTASNGAEALVLASRAECDIILLDVMMPDMAWRIGVALGLAGGIIQVAFALIRPSQPPSPVLRTA